MFSENKLTNKISTSSQNDAKGRQRLKHEKNKITLQELSYFIRKKNIRKRGIPEAKKRKKAVKNLLKQIIDEDFPNL